MPIRTLLSLGRNGYTHHLTPLNQLPLPSTPRTLVDDFTLVPSLVPGVDLVLAEREIVLIFDQALRPLRLLRCCCGGLLQRRLKLPYERCQCWVVVGGRVFLLLNTDLDYMARLLLGCCLVMDLADQWLTVAA